MGNDTNVKTNYNKEVIITVYVESDSYSHQIRSRDRHPKHRKPLKTRIYDRRAHLLAYAQELRKNGDSQQVQCPKNVSKPQHKLGRTRFTTPVRLKRPRGTRSRWRYERLVPEVDIDCSSKWNSGRNKKATGSNTNANVLRRLRCMLSVLWHCNKESKVVDGKHHQAV